MRLSVASAAICLCIVTLSVANDVHASIKEQTNIPAEGLGPALQTLAKERKFQIVYVSEEINALKTQGAVGEFTPEEALNKLLTGTGYTYRYLDDKTVTIVPVAGNYESPTPRAPLTPAVDTTSSPAPVQATSQEPKKSFWDRLRLAQVDEGRTSSPPAVIQTTEGTAANPQQGVEFNEIIVTARKRDESLAQVPESITVFTSQTLAAYNIQSFDDYATKTPNISFAYGGGPTGISDSRTIAIRGITGQNLFGTSGATGFYIDDTPVPGSVDPRVLDIDNIEVLKGPQGTLYGESSLGGNVRLITKRPNLTADDLGYMAQAGYTSGGGSADGGISAIGNIVLSPDVLALRVVLFGNHDAGYLTRTFPSPTSPATYDPFLASPRTSVGNQGAQMTYGGSASLLFKAGENFEARLRLMYQDTDYHGFPAAFAPLPTFEPQYTLNRAFDVQPDAMDRWALPSLELNYHGNGFTVVSSSSYFYRHNHDLEDSTYGTQQILATPGYNVITGSVPGNLPPQPFLWDGEHYHNQVTEELRLSFDPIHNLSGTVGAFYSYARFLFEIPNTYASGLTTASAASGPCFMNPVCAGGGWPNNLLWTQNNPGTQKDTSLFGELYYKFLDKFTATLGGRQYWLKQSTDYTANGFLNFGSTPSSPQENTQSGFNPKFALSYQATDAAMVYASASKGFRSGGAQANFPGCSTNIPLEDVTHVQSDTLWTYEVGTKIQLPQPAILISAAAFRINWSNLQQQVSLPCGFYLTVNGEKAWINGAEVEINGRLSSAFQVHFGVGYEKTDISEPGVLALAGVSPGTEIMDTPAWTASLGGVYTRPINSQYDGFVAADYSYTGNSISLLNSGSKLYGLRPPYSLANLRFGVQHDKSEVSLNLRNLGNAKPNLGDIGYIGYAQFNAAGVVVPQAATLQPFTVLLQYKYNF